MPEGLSSPYQFTDLYNEGIAGILSEQSEGWYYNSNLGEGVFTPAGLVSPKPSLTGLTERRPAIDKPDRRWPEIHRQHRCQPGPF